MILPLTEIQPIPNRHFNMNTTLYISACETPEHKGGIYTFRLTEAGGLDLCSYFSLDRPMYSIRENGLLYALSRELFGRESGVLALKPQHDGSLLQLSVPQSTHGIVACHLSVLENDIYTVNYLSGNVVKLPTEKIVSFSGKGPHPTRQEASHTHCVIPSPHQKYILVTDLGQDKIFVLDRDLKPISECAVPSGHGARHIVFSPDERFLYCINELAATVSVFSWNETQGKLSLLNTYDTQVPSQILPTNTAGAIRVSQDGRHLYISNRGEDTLVVFEITDGVHLRLAQKVSCGGKHPRDFILSPDERFLICTNTDSNSVTVFSMENGFIGDKTATVSIPSPLCVTIGE